MSCNTEELLIIGASGFGKEVLWLAHRLKQPVRGFLDDDKSIIDSSVGGKKVLGPVDSWRLHPQCKLIVAVAHPRIRKKIIDRLTDEGASHFATLIDPTAVYEPSFTQIAAGSILCAGSICTADVEIGKHCIINKLCSIGHDVVIEDFVTLAPQVMLGGHVHIEQGVEIGAGACIRQGLTLHTGSLLGMGSILTKNAPLNTLLMGNPAIPIRQLTQFKC